MAVQRLPLAFHHLIVAELGDVTVVRFRERCLLDHLTFNEVMGELSRVGGCVGSHRIVLNFSDVDRLPSLLLGKLLVLSKKVAEKRGKLLLCEVRPELRDVFSRTRLDQILHIRGAEADAV